MTSEISNTENTIDSREVIARIDDLQTDLDNLIGDAVEEAEGNEIRPSDEDENTEKIEALADWLGVEYADISTLRESIKTETVLKDFHDSSDEAKELFALLALQDEAEGYASDWHHGETLISADYFTQYAQQLAEDIGAIPDDAKWPCNCINWEEAADKLKQDYTEVSFDGQAYFIR